MIFIENMWKFCCENTTASVFALAFGLAFGSVVFAIRLYIIKKPLHEFLAFGASVFYGLILYIISYFLLTAGGVSANASVFFAFIVSFAGGVSSLISLVDVDAQNKDQ